MLRAIGYAALFVFACCCAGVLGFLLATPLLPDGSPVLG
jgi:hypothetical protein